MTKQVTVNELRIGNWLNYIQSNKDVGRPFQITLGDMAAINLTTTNMAWRAIPLTAELLEKCGFEKIPLGNHTTYQGNVELNFGNPILKHQNNPILQTNCKEPNGYIWVGDLRIECKYLHQLQNLYYSLTNTELTVNFNP